MVSQALMRYPVHRLPGFPVLHHIAAQLIQHPHHVIRAKPGPGRQLSVSASQPLLLGQPGAQPPRQRRQQAPRQSARIVPVRRIPVPRRFHAGQVRVEGVLDRITDLILPAGQ